MAFRPTDSVPAVPYFIVPITGDPDRAAGLLTKSGIESVGRFAGDP
jgi:hypothetical protein